MKDKIVLREVSQACEDTYVALCIMEALLVVAQIGGIWPPLEVMMAARNKIQIDGPNLFKTKLLGTSGRI